MKNRPEDGVKTSQNSMSSIVSNSPKLSLPKSIKLPDHIEIDTASFADNTHISVVVDGESPSKLNETTAITPDDHTALPLMINGCPFHFTVSKKEHSIGQRRLSFDNINRVDLNWAIRRPFDSFKFFTFLTVNAAPPLGTKYLKIKDVKVDSIEEHLCHCIFECCGEERFQL